MSRLDSRVFVPVIYGEPVDRPDSVDERDVAVAVAATLRELGWQSDAVAVHPELTEVRALTARTPAFVFNLVDSLGGRDEDGWRAAAELERLGLTFTGAGASALRRTTSKLETRAGFDGHRIPTPEAWTTGSMVPPERTVILKSVLEHGSYGMDHGSVLRGASVAAELARREQRFGGAFYAEEYIDGREFNVALLEGPDGVRVLPVSEILFDGLPPGAPRIVDYEAKWDDTSEAYRGTSRRFGLEQREPLLATEIGLLARRAWAAFSLRGYARVDFRVSAAGAPYALEVNANPCLSAEAGFAATAAHAGIAYPQLIAALAAGALAPTPGA